MQNIEESKLRKYRSIEILKQKNIPYIEWLEEVIDTNSSLRRNTEEVAYRAMALLTVAVKAEGLEKKEVNELIKNYDLSNKFTEKEKEFLFNENIDKITNTQFLWRYEAAWLLLWSLGFVHELTYPDDICDAYTCMSIMTDMTKEEFIQRAKLRPQEEILDQADLILRYHWATRNNRLKGLEPPANLDNSVIMERHYALNWLIGYKRAKWDDISTDT